MSNEYRITKQRKDDLERELEYLRTTRSREVEMVIEEAKSYGDLTENAEYDAAKNEQCKLRGRIAEIENILSHAVLKEEKCLSDDFIAELKELIKSCGLSTKQIESYVDYYRIQFELLEQERYGILPTDQCLETLTEAQKIISGKSGSFELNEYTIDRFLRIPCDQWQAAKASITECFGCSKEIIDELFNKDVEWLFLTPDSVYELADYLKNTLSDEYLSWKIFQQAALLGVEISKARIAAVMDILGEEFGLKIIRMDAEEACWLFYRFYSDPVGCIAYMKDCGLTPEKISTVIRQEPFVLYAYKEGRRLSYCHDQEYIDSIIQKYK